MSELSSLPENPILPDKQAEERPLFFIMAIMSFLTALTVLIGLMGFRLSQTWQQDLSGSVTLQVMDMEAETADRILSLVDELVPDSGAKLISDDEAQDLLKPWIGAIDLPDDLPLPRLIRMDAVASDKLENLKSRFERENLDVEIDDHSVWRKNIKRSWRAVQIALLGIVLLILAASTAISSYATQSVLRARQNIIDVLSHVGATDRYISKLFITRFLSLGLKAAFIGTIAALVAVLILGLFSGMVGNDAKFDVGPKVTDLFYLAGLAVIMGLISGLTAGHITLSKLKQDRLKL